MKNISTVNSGIDFRGLAIARQDNIDRKNKAISKLRIVEKPVIASKMETVYVEVVEVAKLIRKDLKEAFKGIKFSVRKDGNSIDINWELGPDTHSVDAVVQGYAGASFDGSIDLESDIYHEVDGKRIHYSSKYIFCHRNISSEVADKIVQDFLAIGDKGWNDLPDYQIHGQLLEHADLSDGYHGVRRTKMNAGAFVSDIYELY